MQAEPGVADAIRRTWPNASAETIGRLVRLASFVDAPIGPLIAEAEHPPRVALVVSGTVVGTWGAPDGRMLYVGLYGPGQFIGLTALSGGPIASGIDALTRVTLLAWPARDFRAIVDSDAAVTLDLLDLSVYVIQFLNRAIKLRTFTTAAGRLAGLLLQCEASCFSSDTPLVARGQLSALAGVTPQMVSRILRRWEAASIVRRVGASGLELLDRAALQLEAAPLADFPVPAPTRGASMPGQP